MFILVTQINFKFLVDPAGFQVLCFNCNIGKQLNDGTCPHQLQIYS